MLLVDRCTTQLVECWAVVADQPLDELLLELTVDLPSRGPGGVGTPIEAGAVQISYGGELLPEAWPSGPSGRQVVGVRLPRPLNPGEAHEIRLTARAAAVARPTRHVFLPFVPCEVVEIRVRFGSGTDGPVDTWLVDGVPLRPTRHLEALDPLAVRLPVDRVGESSAVFRRPRLGLAHGLQWWPATGAVSEAAGSLPSLRRGT